MCRNATLPSVFLGFRQREAFDADLAAPYAGATSVYTWQGQGYRDYYETYLQVRPADVSRHYDARRDIAAYLPACLQMCSMLDVCVPVWS